MPHTKFSTLFLISALVFSSGLAHAQQNNSTSENAKASDAAMREKAFNLLESLAGQIGSLQSAENRARLRSNVAGSLWTHNEQSARALFVLVEDDIKSALQNGTSDDPRDEHTLQVFLHLREDTVERIARHDAELASRFLQATELQLEKPRHSFEAREQALRLRLAKQTADNNPDIALKFARQSLAQGFSNDLLLLLRQLNRKHKEQALVLYKEIVSKLRDVKFGQDWGLMYFARSLVLSFPPPFGDDASYRDLINMFIANALAHGCGEKRPQDEMEYFCREIAYLIPQMEKVDSSRAAQLKRWAPEIQEATASAEGFYEMNELAQDGSIDEILALASKYPQMEGEIYARAVAKALASDDLERARKIVTTYGGDPERRQLMQAQIDRYQKLASINDQKLAEIQRTVARLPRMRDRVAYLLSGANWVGEYDRNAALKLLQQASELIDTMNPGKEQTEAQMDLAMMYSLEKSDRGFAIMESLVPKLNDLVVAAVKLDGYDNRYLRDGEWNMTAEGGIGSILTQLAQNAGYFAWCDFDRAVSLAAQFERTEIRIMAQLKLAQGILAGPPKRLRLIPSGVY